MCNFEIDAYDTKNEYITQNGNKGYDTIKHNTNVLRSPNSYATCKNSWKFKKSIKNVETGG